MKDFQYIHKSTSMDVGCDRVAFYLNASDELITYPDGQAADGETPLVCGSCGAPLHFLNPLGLQRVEQ